MKIVSGGQTGADRAALDFALHRGMPCGGFCPRGRLAEDGEIPAGYPLQECDSTDYRVRTRRNVLDSHATVVFSRGPLQGGSLLTWQLCQERQRPVLHLDGLQLEPPAAAVELSNFMVCHFVGVLNVAGARASHDAGIYEYTYEVLRLAFAGPRPESSALITAGDS